MNMVFWKLTRELIAQKGLTQTGIARTLNIEVRTFQDWVYSKKLPDTESAKKIADFLGVSLDYLLTGETPEAIVLSESEKHLIDCYRKTPKPLQDVLLSHAEALSDVKGELLTPPTE